MGSRLFPPALGALKAGSLQTSFYCSLNNSLPKSEQHRSFLGWSGYSPAAAPVPRVRP